MIAEPQYSTQLKRNPTDGRDLQPVQNSSILLVVIIIIIAFFLTSFYVLCEFSESANKEQGTQQPRHKFGEIEVEGEQKALVTMRHLSTSAFLKHTPPPSYFCCISRIAQLKRHNWKIVYNNNLVENKMTLYTPVHLLHQSTHCAAALMSLEHRLHNDSFVTNPHVLSTKDYRNVIIQVSPLLSDSMQPA